MGLFRRRSRWSMVKRAFGARTPDPAEVSRSIAAHRPGQQAVRSGLLAVGTTLGVTAASSAISAWRQRGQR